MLKVVVDCKNVKMTKVANSDQKLKRVKAFNSPLLVLPPVLQPVVGELHPIATQELQGGQLHLPGPFPVLEGRQVLRVGRLLVGLAQEEKGEAELGDGHRREQPHPHHVLVEI